MGDSSNGYSHGDKSTEDARKLFIGGLPPQATSDDLRSYFSKYGEVEMSTIKTDVYSGRSRGFGFLIFKDEEPVQQVLNQPEHEIQGKKIDPKLATPQASNKEEKSTKIFVGGLDKSVTKEELTETFQKRGNVQDVYLPADKLTNEPKGFAFINFDNSEIVDVLLQEAKITVGTKECDIKKANSKSESRGGGRGGFRGGRGGFGGGRGGRGGFGGYGGGYDQYGGGYDQYGGGYGGGYGSYQGGSGGYGGYDQSYSGYDQSYGGGYGGGYGAGYDQQAGYSADTGYGAGQDQYKMKGGRGRGGAGFNPY